MVQTLPDVPLPHGFILAPKEGCDKRAVQAAHIIPHSAGIDLLFDVEEDVPSPAAADHRSYHRSVVESIPFREDL